MGKLLDMVFPGHIFSISAPSMIWLRHLTFYVFSDPDNSLDPQVPSVEVLVKAFVLISSAALAAGPSSIIRVIFCSHHPCIVGTGKRDAVWRVMLIIKHRHNLLLYFLFSRICSLLEHIFCLKAVDRKIILYVAIFLKRNHGEMFSTIKVSEHQFAVCIY